LDLLNLDPVHAPQPGDFHILTNHALQLVSKCVRVGESEAMALAPGNDGETPVAGLDPTRPGLLVGGGLVSRKSCVACRFAVTSCVPAGEATVPVAVSPSIPSS
jgi:hypothetical protein